MIGSVKTNIGHLEAAAGVAGLIKVVLVAAARRDPAAPALHRRRTRTSLGTQLPARRADAADAVAPAERPRVAGVSSFGFSGTNAHVVAGGAPPAAPPRPAPADGRATCSRCRRAPTPALRRAGRPPGRDTSTPTPTCSLADVALHRQHRPRRSSRTGSRSRSPTSTRRRAALGAVAAGQTRAREAIAGHVGAGRVPERRVPVHRAGRAVRRHGPRALRDASRSSARRSTAATALLRGRLDRTAAADVLYPGAGRGRAARRDGLHAAGAVRARVRAGRAVAVVGRPAGRGARPQRRRVRRRLRGRRVLARGRRCGSSPRAAG